MRSLITTALCVFFLANFSFAQASEQSDGKTYKNAKVKLTSGEILKGKNITVSDSELNLTINDSIAPKTLALSDVEYIQVARMNYLPLGAVIGGTITYGAIALITSNEDEKVTYHGTVTKTNIYDEYGRRISSTSDYSNIEFEEEESESMSTATKIAIVAGGVVVGASIGYTIKGGWEKIYPTEEISKKVSLEFSLSNNSYVTPIVAMRFKF